MTAIAMTFFLYQWTVFNACTSTHCSMTAIAMTCTGAQCSVTAIVMTLLPVPVHNVQWQRLSWTCCLYQCIQFNDSDCNDFVACTSAYFSMTAIIMTLWPVPVHNVQWQRLCMTLPVPVHTVQWQRLQWPVPVHNLQWQRLQWPCCLYQRIMVNDSDCHDFVACTSAQCSMTAIAMTLLPVPAHNVQWQRLQWLCCLYQCTVFNVSDCHDNAIQQYLERRAEADSNRGLKQPNALPLGQTGSRHLQCLL